MLTFRLLATSVVVSSCPTRMGWSSTPFGWGKRRPPPNGVVIHPNVRIGINCLIFQQVTLGHAGSGVPTVGDHVDFGAGAKVLGAITIGDGAVIGANAVVLMDVPPGATAVGVPAKILGAVR